MSNDECRMSKRTWPKGLRHSSLDIRHSSAATTSLLLAIFAASLLLRPALLRACDMCEPLSTTFTQEIASARAVVVARLETPSKVSRSGDDAEAKDFEQLREASKATFRVEKILKGGELFDQASTIRALHLGDHKIGTLFLLTGAGDPELFWNTPTELSPSAWPYIRAMIRFPDSGVERLAFALDYLEHPEEMISRDAYDEFARAKHEHVVALRDQMRPDDLIARIQNPKTPYRRRRLYFTMLGACGRARDSAVLETMIRSDAKKYRKELDAMLSCYLILRGAEGLALVETQFLQSDKSDDLPQATQAIRALQFLGQQDRGIDRAEIVAVMHRMLKRPQLAARVVLDLSRWQDWSVMDEVAGLFLLEGSEYAWLRPNVAQYLLACPLPEADEHLARLEKIDPVAIARARQQFSVAVEGLKGDTMGNVANSASETASDPAANQQDSSGSVRGALPRVVILAIPLAVIGVIVVLFWVVFRPRRTKDI